jgi:hypothetical protein
MKWLQSRASSPNRGNAKATGFTWQQAIDQASHPRQPELDSVRSPRYGAFVEPVPDGVRIHLLREWGQRERRIDSVACNEFAADDVEAAASFLEDVREEALSREQRDLEEWHGAHERAEARRASAAERASRAKRASSLSRPQPLSARHQRELEDMREARRQREQHQALTEKRIAAIEAHGLADALIAQLKDRP